MKTNTAEFRIQLDEGAVMPEHHHLFDVGYDVRIKDVKFIAQKFYGKWYIRVKIDTGVHVQPKDMNRYFTALVPNSRIVKSMFTQANSIGIIDPEYTGSIKVVFDNNSLNIRLADKVEDELEKAGQTEFEIPAENMPKSITELFAPGKVCGQLICMPAIFMQFTEEPLETTTRGSGGFGSTEKK